MNEKCDYVLVGGSSDGFNYVVDDFDCILWFPTVCYILYATWFSGEKGSLLLLLCFILVRFMYKL